MSDAPADALTDAAAKRAQAQTTQRRASDPAASAWVGASAGTGKTKVLTDRVLALLVTGTAPERVLCLTFTKAAAAEMANRLSGRLAAWATAETEALDADLTGLLNRAPRKGERRRGRELFARVLDAAGGMKIQTLHAFCQAVLGRFPLEAGISPQAHVLDESSATELIQGAREAVLALAGGDDGDPWLGDALAEIAAQAADSTFGELLDALLSHRGRVLRFRDDAGGLDALSARVAAALGVPDSATPAQVWAEACADDAVDTGALGALAAAYAAGTAKEQRDKLPLVTAWRDGTPEDRAAVLEDYMALFVNKTDGALKQKPLAKAAAAVPGASDAAHAEGERLQGVQARANAAAVVRATAALLRLGTTILDRYEAMKRARALLDYDDLILATRDLLRQEDIAPWVLFKLDGGLDHVLIDEAQDTNPEQWEVVDLLTREFFAGEGAADATGRGPRTVFAVGDAKQSIYSFQRADPRAFARMRAHFAERVQAAQQAWHPVDLTVSFRSTDAVLRAVDRVFAQPEAQAGVRLDGHGAVHHDPVRVGDAGKVEVWPPAESVSVEPPEVWAPPTRTETALPPRERLARTVAARIAYWVHGAGGEESDGWLAARGRRMQPGDILILVRRRNAFMDTVVRELKQRAVPVAGVDRMVLTEQLAVRDLMALGQVLILPEDDMSLACVLKGPLIGLSETALFDLAHARKGRLWDALRDRAGERGDFERAYTRLSDLMARADQVPPYEFFATLLGAGGGRAAILARLGPEANDPLDEFLAAALTFERDHVPSLQGFLYWLDAGQQDIKRDAEHGADAVRVMTVHGAKGLQAPVVILPDTMQPPRFTDKLLWDEARGLVLWSPRTALDDKVAGDLRSEAKQAQAEEYRRLLYVALTRAEDQLHVCGWTGQKTPPAEGWYPLVRAALAADPAVTRFDFAREVPEGWAGEGLRLETTQRRSLDAAGPDAAEAERPSDSPEPPPWAWTPPAAEPAPPRPLAPSRAPAAEPPARSPLSTPGGAAYARGRLIHRLLQSLPDLAPAERRAAGWRLLAAQPALDDDARAAVLDEVMAVLDDPAFAPLFAPGSRAEVPVVGLLAPDGRPEPVSGRIDRLVVLPDKIIVIDFKTNRPPPETAAEVPAVYRDQLAAYRRMLGDIYPDRPVETWLLWTDAPRLMQISDAEGG